MAESLWKHFAELPLQIEGYALERLEKPVTRGFTRVTTIVRLRGGGGEGLGEDVPWYPAPPDGEQAAGPVLPLAGSWSLETFSAGLEMPDPPRRWAYERAALDLALRQGGRGPCEAPAPPRGRGGAGAPSAPVGGREPKPVAFVISPGLGTPPTSAVV